MRIGALIGRLRGRGETAEPDPVSRMMLTTRRYPVYCLPIARCGSTFLKTLFYRLDHDTDPPDPAAIDDSPDLLRAGDVEPGFIAGSRFAFAVLRDPLERFLSLYFDKLAHDGPGSLSVIRETLRHEAGFDLAPAGLEAHRRNCHLLAGWLARNLAGRTETPVNPRWRPQSWHLKRAAALSPVHLTLDGLDWQLPMLLGPAIPDLPRIMAQVSARNRTERHPTAGIADEALAGAVRRLYARDAELHAEAAALWDRRRAEGWENRPAPPPSPPRLGLTGCHRAPFRFVPVPKAGCTLLRNLAYLIDHGRPHPDPLAIQADRCLLRQEIAPDSHDGLAFIVLRDPVPRFLSLYLDKVVGTGPHAFPWIAERLSERRGFRTGTRLRTAQHRANCHHLLDFIAARMASEGRAKVNPHWRAQTVWADRVRPFGLKALVLEEIETQLPAHLGHAVPDLPGLMARLGRPNRSGRRPGGIVDGPLETRILELYAPDRVLHRRVRDDWARDGRAPTI